MKILAIFLIPFIACITYAAEISVRWDLPTTFEDGRPIEGLVGAKIYYGLSSSNYTVVIDVGHTNRCTITNLTLGEMYYINGTAYYIDGIESAFTDEVHKQAHPHLDKPVYVELFIGE